MRPIEDEKMTLVALKIIDTFLAKQIPQIWDFFVFNTLQKFVQRTDWIKPSYEEVQM